MKIVIESEKLKELLDKGIKRYYINKRYSQNIPMVDTMLREVETYVAFDKQGEDYEKHL